LRPLGKLGRLLGQRCGNSGLLGEVRWAGTSMLSGARPAGWPLTMFAEVALASDEVLLVGESTRRVAIDGVAGAG